MNLLLGPASLDIYVQEGRVLPGGGALNMAYHWSRLGLPFHFLTRIGDDHPEVFLRFLRRHGIAHSPSIVGTGVSASIDIVIGDDRQPHMDHFVEGVWTGFRLDAAEQAMVTTADRMHAVLVDPVVAEVHRLGDEGALERVSASGDFLSFRHYSLDRFAATMAHLDLGVIGWPGAEDDPLVQGMGTVAFDLGRVVVVTLGSRGVLVFDGRGTPTMQRIPVDAVAVNGTTVGCGDAFVAALLADWWATADLLGAVEAGKRAGAAATTWLRPLPDAAYESDDSVGSNDVIL